MDLKRGVELASGPDVQLPEDPPEVPLDGTGTEKQLRPDLDVRQAVSGEPRDLGLLRRQSVTAGPSRRAISACRTSDTVTRTVPTAASAAQPGRIWWVCLGCDDLVTTPARSVRLAWLGSVGDVRALRTAG